jgi:FeoB-associated Cys-rich membrane protein
MGPQLQTVIALALVALAATLLVRSWFNRKKSPGCGSDCGAVSPELKRLQAKLKR